VRRVDALKIIGEEADSEDAVVVVHLGFPARELYHVYDRPLNFYMLGSMGQSCSVGLGLALSLPNDVEVLAVEGDGGLMMNMGILPTIAQESPPNYSLVLVDNSAYDTTGGQPTPSERINWRSVAEAHGMTYLRAKDERSLRDALRSAMRDEGPHMVHAIVERGNADVPLIDMTPHEIISRFTRALEKRVKSR